VSESVRVSVVIPVREPPGDLGTVVRSVLESQLTELEVIVVQNGVPDPSGALASLDDPRLVTVRLHSGPGMSRPLNVGVARARAPYVAFLWPDEVIRPERLGAAVEALDRHPQAGLAFTDFDYVDGNGAVVRASAAAPALQTLTRVPLENGWSLIPQSQLARALLARNFVALSSVVLRRQLLTEIGPFDERIFHCADLDLWFRLAHRCDALYRDQVGHSCGSCCASGLNPEDARSARDRITLLRREKERWSERAAQRLLDRRIAQSYAEMGYEERRRRHRLRSIAMFASAFAMSPQRRWLRGMLGEMR
jgi:glycosyltransferase involved in cell wall biosynthesis